MKISGFFQQSQTSYSTTSVQQSKMNDNRSPNHQFIVKPSTTTAQEEPAKRMTIILNVEQPEIILVEAMDDINCHALILNVTINYNR